MKFMGRKRTRLELASGQRAELRRRLQALTHQRDKERVQLVLWAATGKLTLEDLAHRSGRVRSTIQVWLAKFNESGLMGLLDRHSPPGSTSPLRAPRIQQQLEAGLRAGQWRSAGEIALWLKEAHGIQRARKSLYYWLANSGWPAPGRRPVSP